MKKFNEWIKFNESVKIGDKVTINKGSAAGKSGTVIEISDRGTVEIELTPEKGTIQDIVSIPIGWIK